MTMPAATDTKTAPPRKLRPAVGCGALLLWAVASLAGSSELVNLTGLPAYPNLSSARMDPVLRTDVLGHWCAHFAATTADSPDHVEVWYRNTWRGASETDLTHDRTYQSYADLEGIKLAIGLDSVLVYRLTRQAPTSIDLYRCSPMG
jgi:hypothetical protein